MCIRDSLYRVLLPKAPKWSRLLLWALAAVRLALPVSVKSAWSLVPSETVLDYKTAQYAAKPELTSGIASFNSAVNPVFGEHCAANPQGSVNPLQVWMHIAGGIWSLGVLVLLVLAFVSFWKVRRRVGASIELSPGVRPVSYTHLVMPWPLWLASVTETVCSCSSPHPDSASSTSTSASSRQSFFFICFLLHIPEIDFERCGGEMQKKPHHTH